jgi:T5SS/PEP-CTERM-associated repeat protein
VEDALQYVGIGRFRHRLEEVTGERSTAFCDAGLFEPLRCAFDSGLRVENKSFGALDADCIIGDDTEGTFIIKAKATVNANQKTITIGNQKTGNGNLTVDGGGAELDNINSLIVGKAGAC